MIHYLNYYSKISIVCLYYIIQKEFISFLSSLVSRLQFKWDKLYKNADLNKLKVTTSWPFFATIKTCEIIIYKSNRNIY